MSKGSRRFIAPNSRSAEGHQAARRPRNSCTHAKSALGRLRASRRSSAAQSQTPRADATRSASGHR
eukprot:15471355-Alexandrium_andersonii.AAC.1